MPNPLGMSDRDWAAVIGTIAGEYGLATVGRQAERDTIIGAAMIADTMANRQVNPAYANTRDLSFYGIAHAPNQYNAWDADKVAARTTAEKFARGAIDPQFAATKFSARDQQALDRFSVAAIGVLSEQGPLRGVAQGAVMYGNRDLMGTRTIAEHMRSGIADVDFPTGVPGSVHTARARSNGAFDYTAAAIDAQALAGRLGLDAPSLGLQDDLREPEEALQGLGGLEPIDTAPVNDLSFPGEYGNKAFSPAPPDPGVLAGDLPDPNLGLEVAGPGFDEQAFPTGAVEAGPDLGEPASFEDRFAGPKSATFGDRFGQMQTAFQGGRGPQDFFDVGLGQLGADVVPDVSAEPDVTEADVGDREFGGKAPGIGHNGGPALESSFGERSFAGEPAATFNDRAQVPGRETAFAGGPFAPGDVMGVGEGRLGSDLDPGAIDVAGEYGGKAFSQGAFGGMEPAASFAERAAIEGRAPSFTQSRSQNPSLTFGSMAPNGFVAQSQEDRDLASLFGQAPMDERAQGFGQDQVEATASIAETDPGYDRNNIKDGPPESFGLAARANTPQGRMDAPDNFARVASLGPGLTSIADAMQQGVQQEVVGGPPSIEFAGPSFDNLTDYTGGRGNDLDDEGFGYDTSAPKTETRTVTDRVTIPGEQKTISVPAKSTAPAPDITVDLNNFNQPFGAFDVSGFDPNALGQEQAPQAAAKVADKFTTRTITTPARTVNVERQVQVPVSQVAYGEQSLSPATFGGVESLPTAADYAAEGLHVSDYMNDLSRGMAAAPPGMEGWAEHMNDDRYGTAFTGAIHDAVSAAPYGSAAAIAAGPNHAGLHGDAMIGHVTDNFSPSLMGGVPGTSYPGAMPDSYSNMQGSIGRGGLAAAMGGFDAGAADFGSAYGFGANSGIGGWGDISGPGLGGYGVGNSLDGYGLSGVDGTFGGGFSDGSAGGGFGGGFGGNDFGGGGYASSQSDNSMGDSLGGNNPGSDGPSGGDEDGDDY